MSVLKQISLLLLAIGLSACSTKLDVGTISHPGAKKTKGHVGGLPFRENRAHSISLFAYDEKSKTYKRLSQFTEVIASPDAVYYLATDSYWLSDSTLKVTPRSDGTLNIVNITSDNKSLATVDALVSELNTLRDAKDAEITADQASALACVEAEVALDIAQETENALTTEATALERAKAEGDVQIAEIKKRNACVQE